MKRVFIDGSAGTTGLRIYERLSRRDDIELMTLTEEFRKDVSCRKKALDAADIAILCLPDDAAREAVGLIENPDTVVIDTSTAHRVADGWVYGFPELSDAQREKIKHSKRIANPGCHASGFIALVAPLVQAGIIKSDAKLTCFSITGYSGGGKKMIAEYRADKVDPFFVAPRQYGLSQQHKHLPEMQAVCGLKYAPAFCPIVAPFYSGMEVTVPLFADESGCSVQQIREVYREHYRRGLVRFADDADEGRFLSAAALSGRDDMEIAVFGGERILLTARFDNLGKGASGSAIQNLNILLRTDETKGLCTTAL